MNDNIEKYISDDDIFDRIKRKSKMTELIEYKIIKCNFFLLVFSINLLLMPKNHSWSIENDNILSICIL